MAVALTLAWGAMPSTSAAQTHSTSKLIQKDRNPQLSQHREDEQALNIAKGMLTAVAKDVIYVNGVPFRITPYSRIVNEEGYEASSVTYEKDLTAVVKYKADPTTGGEDIPIVVFVRIYAMDPQ
jgi:hypothetical protein